MPLKISAFPKCYLEEIASGRMSVFEWIEMAKQLDADGLEMYEAFSRALRTPIWIASAKRFIGQLRHANVLLLA